MGLGNANNDWTSSWLDAVAFALGLAVAWRAGWNTGDLVWSLWLSSFVVGYSATVWMIGSRAFAIARASWPGRALFDENPQPFLLFWALIFVGALFMLAFFTVHFGGFHYGHSQFLISFFPNGLPGTQSRAVWAGTDTYFEVLRRYWPFLPSAFLAHRAAFVLKPVVATAQSAAKQLRGSDSLGQSISAPYRSVMTMHFLIFFFFIAHFARLENFAVYAVVYAVYFFPWRLVRRGEGRPVLKLPLGQGRANAT
jgi:hypothetical protein